MKLVKLGISTIILAGTALAVSPGFAKAETHHKLQKGENLSMLAQRYHVSVEAILKVNHLGNGNTVPIGTVVTIPDPPKHIVARGTLYLPRQINANRVSVRFGPGQQHPLLTCIDSGTHVIVTARHDHWSQIALANGSTGWVESNFIGGAPARSPEAAKVQVARAVRAPTATRSARRVQRIASVVHTTHAHASGNKAHVPARRLALVRAKHDAQLARAAKSQRVAQAAAANRHRLAEAKAKRATEVALAAKRHRLAAADAVRIASTRRGVRKVPAASPVRVALDSRSGSRSGTGKRGLRIVQTAFAYRGTPYVYGGSGRGGFDCSGFTRYVFAKHGVSLPHSARAQFELGHKVSFRSLKAGDLVFFHTVTPGISHVGVYVGDGRFVHAASRRSGGVREDSLASGYYRSAFRGARRVR